MQKSENWFFIRFSSLLISCKFEYFWRIVKNFMVFSINTWKLCTKPTITRINIKIGKFIFHSIQHIPSSIKTGAKLRVGGFCISLVGKKPVSALQDAWLMYCLFVCRNLVSASQDGELIVWCCYFNWELCWHIYCTMLNTIITTLEWSYFFTSLISASDATVLFFCKRCLIISCTSI